jgi:S-methylmethionine-dependent homocysteine/selenocysteine methylase
LPVTPARSNPGCRHAHSRISSKYDEPIDDIAWPSQAQATHVLDGGMASELEFLGADISGPLWSAHVLEDAPEKVVAVHRAYLEAGADILLTASYQVSRKGYAEFGLRPRADAALLRSVELALPGSRGVSEPQDPCRGIARPLRRRVAQWRRVSRQLRLHFRRTGGFTGSGSRF